MRLFQLLQGKNFSHHYQPIIKLSNGDIAGLEALFRPHFFHYPEHAFQQAKKKNKLFELDVCALDKAVRTFRQGRLLPPEKLFIALYPSTMMNPRFVPILLQIIHHYAIPAKQLILEIVAHETIDNLSELRAAIQQLKKMGFTIALDDMGKGSDNIYRTIDLAVDYMKLDLDLSKGLARSDQKQAYVRFLIRYCKRFDVKLILKGIENERDLHSACSLGVVYGQGSAIHKPRPIKFWTEELDPNGGKPQHFAWNRD